jgi:hypothetical protein
MCECCRLASALTADGRPVVVLRDVVEGVRDHAVLTFKSPSAPGPVMPLPADRWEINGCPHHGPSLAIAPDGAYHIVWFTDGQVRKGAFYAHSRDAGRTWSTPMAMSGGGRALRPYVLAAGTDVWLTWKEQADSAASVFVRRSADGGRTWSSAREVASSRGSSDHPLLLAHAGRAYLSWLTRPEGYRLIPLTPAP